MPPWHALPAQPAAWNNGNTSAAKDLLAQTHLSLLQVWVLAQVPQVPPQPSLPHVLPLQLGVQPHWPVWPQACPDGQLPQVPPQPSGPQTRPAQLGAHAHCPVAEQAWPPAQVPHEPPQPSGPQVLPSQLGTHAHWPALEHD
jgi:hypothetical protein